MNMILIALLGISKIQIASGEEVGSGLPHGLHYPSVMAARAFNKSQGGSFAPGQVGGTLILTRNPDGSDKINPVWVILAEGRAYIRSSTEPQWLENLKRTGWIIVNKGRVWTRYGYELVSDPKELKVVDDALVNQFGLPGKIAVGSPYRMHEPVIIRLLEN
jgi:hypothetical protein